MLLRARLGFSGYVGSCHGNWRQMLKKQQYVKIAMKTSIKWVCGEQKKKRWIGGCQPVQGIFLSASNIGFKQEESALGLGFLLCQDTVFIPQNQHLSLLVNFFSTFSLETSLSREEICYFEVFSFIFCFSCSELLEQLEGLEEVLIPLFLRESFCGSFPWLIPTLCGHSQMSHTEKRQTKTSLRMCRACTTSG